jgi:tetratricopeptide (TPR) repeat protein
LKQHPNRHDPASAEVCKHIQDHFDACQQLIAGLRRADDKDPRLVATYENANGMSNMYLTDYVVREAQQRRSHLDTALKSLDNADKELPRDWANTCDMGSVHLRLAVLARETDIVDTAKIESHFAAAKERLTHVINELRPEYGFALFELGILHRVWGKWTEAFGFMQRALQVPKQYRDVSDNDVAAEQARIGQQDNSYP